MTPVTEDPNFAEPEHALGRVGWATVPICSFCYARENPGREPFYLREAPLEVCYRCVAVTEAGIYYRGYAKVVQVMVPVYGLVAAYEAHPVPRRSEDD